MNLKQAFYKDYYQDIDFRKVSNNSDLKKSIEEQNARKFKAVNNRLFNYTFQKEAFTYLKLADCKLPNFAHFQLSTTYPGLLTGIGMVHETNNQGELKLGFFFDHTSGLPMLPGSSVKGAIRGAFPNFRSIAKEILIPDLTLPAKKDQQVYLQKQKNKARWIGHLLEWAEQEAALYNKVHQLELAIFEGVDILKKKANRDKEGNLPMSKRCRFLDAIIVQSGNAGNKILGIDALTPHRDNPLKNPIPLPFLKILPKVVFQFQFMLPTLPLDGYNLEGAKLEALFKAILIHFGMGAKTNVGYGQFTDDIPRENTSGYGSVTPSTPPKKQDKWEEVIPDKAIPSLKNGNQVDGNIARIEGDNVFVQFTIAGETGEIRKKYRAIRDNLKQKLTSLEQVAAGMPVTIKIQQDYRKFGEPLSCQVKLKN